jgi:hypothetical protein
MVHRAGKLQPSRHIVPRGHVKTAQDRRRYISFSHAYDWVPRSCKTLFPMCEFQLAISVDLSSWYTSQELIAHGTLYTVISTVRCKYMSITWIFGHHCTTVRPYCCSAIRVACLRTATPVSCFSKAQRCMEYTIEPSICQNQVCRHCPQGWDCRTTYQFGY